ncbi:hypothetical protein ACH4GK_37565 [Streptomyces rimosus]|uniref:DUF6197 family protein n=1 Tax=Streptomyces rimosus TaxID=1927 RepID=UPI0004CAE944|nr:hypothetical protein [Streptomyces rimosus]
MPHTPTSPATRRPAPTAPTAPVPAPAVDLSLEERLALVEAAMTVRLDTAAVAYEVNTAHLATEPVDLADVVTGPTEAAESAGIAARPLPELYPTPVAALLQRAHHRLLTDGWCTGTLVDTDGARCLYGAVHAEAGGSGRLESDALDVLLDTIRRQFGDSVESVPTFNDAFGSPSVPLRLLGQAALLADARGL